MDISSCFLEFLWFRCSRISSTIHLMHGTKYYSNIHIFHFFKKSFILDIKSTIGNLCRSITIRRKRDMIDSICSQLIHYFMKIDRLCIRIMIENQSDNFNFFTILKRLPTSKIFNIILKLQSMDPYRYC